MDTKMKTIIPSLQDMALVKIVTSLWNESNIIHHIFSRPLFPTPTSHTLNRVRENIETLDLPVVLRSRLHSITGPISEEISSWLMSDYVGVSVNPKCQHLFYWTSLGTLDTESTVMGLLRNEEMILLDRFRMACRYCLESEIYSLWDKIDKNSIGLKQIQRQLLSNGIVKFWTFKMDPNISRLPHNRHRASFHPRSCNYLRIIQEAVANKNFPAVKYFFPKLTTEEKKKFWSDFSSNVLAYSRGRKCTPADILNFVFSSMDHEYQNELLSQYSYTILCTFSNWPWQNYFLEYSKLCWNFLSLQEFQRLLEIIHSRPHDSWGNRLYFYEVLFEEFWMQSPIPFRKFMVNSDFNNLFGNLDDADENKISLFLEHTSLEERKRIIFSEDAMTACSYLLSMKHMVLFSRFLDECLSTAELVVHFREDFAEFLMARPHRWGNFETAKSELLRGVDVIFDSLLKKRSDEENGGSKNMCKRNS